MLDSKMQPQFLHTFTYETPFFFIDKEKILANFHRFKDLFPHSEIQYAIKANSEPELLRTLITAGCGFEIASKYELEFLKSLQAPADKIIYGTSVKPIAHIKEVFAYGVDRFACDSFSELEKIASVAPNARVYIRAIANDTGSVFKFSEKFGAPIENVLPLLLKAKELGLKPYGISFHVGSQASNPQAWANTLQILQPVIEELQKNGITLDIVNIGGGYPCRYNSSPEAPSLEEIATYTLAQYQKLPYQPTLLLEPGRGIVADAAVLVASIIAKVERQGNTWLFLDAGVYNGLFETMAYQGSTRYPISAMRPAGNSGEKIYEIAGPTGDSPDVISREALLPQDLEVGDKLIISHVGAYSLPLVSQFNGFPKPNVYYS
jgi:ornithine decarboxylase